MSSPLASFAATSAAKASSKYSFRKRNNDYEYYELDEETQSKKKVFFHFISILFY